MNCGCVVRCDGVKPVFAAWRETVLAEETLSCAEVFESNSSTSDFAAGWFFHSICIYLLSCWYQLKRDHCCQLCSIKVDWRGKHHLRLSSPQPCPAAWQVMGTPALGLSSLPVNTAGDELRVTSKAHKAAVMPVAWQRDAEFIQHIKGTHFTCSCG